MAANPVQVERMEVEEREETLALFDLALRGLSLPLTLKLARPLTSGELLAFCEANDGFEIEYGAGGTLTVMSPAFKQASRFNQILVTKLAHGLRRTAASSSGRTSAYSSPTWRCAVPIAPGFPQPAIMRP